MHGGFLLDPLPLVTAMVHPVGDVRQFQRPLLHLGPSFPPPLDLAALLLVQLARLFPQPLRAKAARRRQQAGMVTAMVALPPRGMDRHIPPHPMPSADFPPSAQGPPPAPIRRHNA